MALGNVYSKLVFVGGRVQFPVTGGSRSLFPCWQPLPTPRGRPCPKLAVAYPILSMFRISGDLILDELEKRLCF